MIAPYGCVPRRVLEDRLLPVTARLLYAQLLCLPPEPDGSVLTTNEKLAEQLGLSVSTVKRRMLDLQAAALVERLQRGRPAYRERPPTASRYLLLEVVPGSRPQKRGEVGLKVAAQPEPEALHVDGVVGAQALDVTGVGHASAAPHGAGGAAGVPAGGGLRFVEMGMAGHEHECFTASGVRGSAR